MNKKIENNENLKAQKITILANCQEGQIRVAILNNSEITDLFIERKNNENILGNIYIATVSNILQNLEAIFLDAGLEKAVYLSFSEIENFDVKNYKKGDKILIQIIKGPISTKGSKATTKISLPGRYLVYKPFSKDIGISKNIIDEKKRKKLKNILEKLSKNLSGGIICRTETEKIKDTFLEKILKKEITYLAKVWENIDDKFQKTKDLLKTPKLLHEDYDILIKIIREKLNEKVEKFIIDSKEEFKKVLKFVNIISPELKNRITFYDGEKSLFEAYNLERIFENIVKQRISLKSGGYLIIQEAESLCAIDVNSGRTKGENLKAVALKTNLEAVREIALQLRLRNIGGIIVIDFIDMCFEDQKTMVLEAMEKAVKFDKAKIKIFPINELGLIEMTRQRKTESILDFLSETCPCCDGKGKIYSKETILLNIKNDLLKTSEKNKIKNSKNRKFTTKNYSFQIILNPVYKKFLNKTRMNFLKNNIKEAIEVVYKFEIPINNYEILTNVK